MSTPPPPPPPPTTRGINHIGISIPDIHAAVAWYTSHLSFRLLKGPLHFKRDPSIAREQDKHNFQIYPHPFAEAYIAYLLDPNGVGLELFQFVQPEQLPAAPWGEELYATTGPYHVVLTHPDPVGLCERLERVGGRKLAGPVEFGEGSDGRRRSVIVYMQDPWGVVLEVLNKPFAEVLLDA